MASSPIFLVNLGFKVSQSDTSLFTKHEGNDTTVVLVYIDDIIIIENNSMKISEIKKSLKERFEIKDLGRLKYFLGIEIAHSIKGLFIFQRKYILDLLKETGKLGSKPATIPIDCNYKLNIEECEPLKDVTQYQ
jgi:Reverse transcriptase (RNA-dependent DNA polymerase)